MLRDLIHRKSNFYISKSSWRNRLTCLFLLKLILNGLIIINTIGELIWRLHQSKDQDSNFIIFGSVVFYPICLMITTLLALIMLLNEKKYLIRSSPSLSIFWALLLLCYIPVLNNEIQLIQENFGRLITRTT